MTEFKLRQTFSNGYHQYCFGPKILKIDKDFKYIIYYDNIKIPLTFISNTRFGNPNFETDIACRDVETHTIFRANHDDLVVIRRYNNKKITLDRIDFLNIEFRPY